MSDAAGSPLDVGVVSELGPIGPCFGASLNNSPRLNELWSWGY